MLLLGCDSGIRNFVHYPLDCHQLSRWTETAVMRVGRDSSAVVGVLEGMARSLVTAEENRPKSPARLRETLPGSGLDYETLRGWTLIS